MDKVGVYLKLEADLNELLSGYSEFHDTTRSGIASVALREFFRSRSQDEIEEEHYSQEAEGH